MKFLGLLFCGCMMVWQEPSTAQSLKSVEFGARDDISEKAINRINYLADLRASSEYKKLLDSLEKELVVFKNNTYAKQRIRNEIADLLSNQLLDIERAISIDEENLLLDIVEHDDEGAFSSRYLVANQKIIVDRDYLSNYVRLSGTDLKSATKSRLARNRSLMLGEVRSGDSPYTAMFLKQHLVSVKNDIFSTQKKSAARHTIISRLIRAEYELLKLGQALEGGAQDYILNGEISLQNIDLSEIDFLSLADYFSAIFKKTGNIKFAEYALETIYRPYQNLRDSNARWKYNKIINEYINTLIDENYRSTQYEEMFYYVSLNKSRMLLEEGIAFNNRTNTALKIADLVAKDGIPRTDDGLPQKNWFKKQLAATPAFLDFYLGGKFKVQSKTATNTVAIDRGTMPLNLRDFNTESSKNRNAKVVEGGAESFDTFEGDVLYVTQVTHGKVRAVKRVAGATLAALKRQLDDSYRVLANNRQGADAKSLAIFKDLQADITLPAKVTISPDKWLLKHPLDLHLNVKGVRSVNFFMTGNLNEIQTQNVVGFFNPTLDLNGAEQEAKAIRSFFPNAQVYLRENAKLSALESASAANVVHLSMHGEFNDKNAGDSRLLFAGANKKSTDDDPNGLYARDMGKYSALRDRDLIFAAACQTGLSAADNTNENELTGILRPLTANRNKNVILSLWNVDDAATRDFVTAFYQKLASTSDVVTSFHFAQDEVRNKYGSPYYWAAFYLSQAR